jgi:hypothetical protein
MPEAGQTDTGASAVAVPTAAPPTTVPSPTAEPATSWAAPSGPSAPSPADPVAGPRAAASGQAGSGPSGRGFRQRPIPLRPLTVLELIDGAVGAVGAVPRFLLLRAAAVIAGCAAVALALTWWLDHSVSSLVRQNPSWPSTDLFGDPITKFAPSLGERWSLATAEILIAVVCSGFASTVLAGLFAPSVKAYVDAEPPSAEQARALLRGRTGRLFGLAALANAPRLIPAALFALLARIAAADPARAIVGWYLLVCLGCLPLCFWLTSLTAVAAPAAVLEGAHLGTALRRARRLAAHGTLRIGWCCLLTLLIVAAATAALDLFGWQLRDAYGVGAQFAGFPGSPGFSWWLVGYAAAYLLTLLATTPFRAATATLLYVDRRFRREGLDIRIGWARLANNSSPRTRPGAAR